MKKLLQLTALLGLATLAIVSRPALATPLCTSIHGTSCTTVGSHDQLHDLRWLSLHLHLHHQPSLALQAVDVRLRAAFHWADRHPQGELLSILEPLDLGAQSRRQARTLVPSIKLSRGR
jgi:hypothetical protein